VLVVGALVEDREPGELPPGEAGDRNEGSPVMRYPRKPVSRSTTRRRVSSAAAITRSV
jgi:hypothetical protein